MVNELQLRLKERVNVFELIFYPSSNVMAREAEETAAMNVTEVKSRPDVHNADKHWH